MAGRALVKVPARARRGDVVAITALAAHPMETGYRTDAAGRSVPRNIVERFTCRYNGVEVFAAELFPAVTANPFLSFTTIATESGELEFTWTDDRGETIRASASIVVE